MASLEHAFNRPDKLVKINQDTTLIERLFFDGNKHILVNARRDHVNSSFYVMVNSLHRNGNKEIETKIMTVEELKELFSSYENNSFKTPVFY